jgi:hypothetical protein
MDQSAEELAAADVRSTPTALPNQLVGCVNSVRASNRGVCRPNCGGCESVTAPGSRRRVRERRVTSPLFSQLLHRRPGGTRRSARTPALQDRALLAGQRRKRLISSPRCRSVRPASVFERAIPHWARMRPARTEPIFGTTKRTSRIRAVLTQAGGSERIGTSPIFPDASCFFSSALAARTSFACTSARRRCSRDLPGTPAPGCPRHGAILEPEQAGGQQQRRTIRPLRPSTPWPVRLQRIADHREAAAHAVSPAKSPVRKAEPNLRTPHPRLPRSRGSRPTSPRTRTCRS